FTHHGQFKGQTVVALTTPHTRLKLSFHDIFWESCQPISGPDIITRKGLRITAKAFSLSQPESTTKSVKSA
ncbi:hypothetical protein, partial [Hymenobacter antarcticus]|uniref:hypothetical protein n=1 Tax=Hymenobacter antarcticus TaxID=486270 RepID=UPI0031EAC74B